MTKQRCPACNLLHNVSIYVSGQQVRCSNCGLPFVVERDDSVIFASAVMKTVGANREDTLKRQAVDGGGRAASGNLTVGAGQASKLTWKSKQLPAGSSVLSIPGYRLYELLGKGGMGQVYRALQESLHRVVAIKVLNEDLAEHSSFVRRFEKESGALAALSHPNIVTVIDRGHVGSTYYFVMEYIDGPSLRTKMNHGELDVREAADFMVVMCRAVEHAHQRGVIHRDLKPENVLFTSEGVIKVADFGLANIMRPERHWELTRTKVSMGTANYMAPEQQRDAKHVDHRADIYSLGVMFYEMLVGELPLGKFDPPSAHGREIDQRIDKLVLKMLESNPARRFQRAELAASFLQNLGQFNLRNRSSTFGEKPICCEARASQHQAPAEICTAEQAGSRSLGSIRPRLSSRLMTLGGGLLLLVLAAIGIISLLFYQDLESSPGDLVYRRMGEKKHLQVSHPRQVKYLAPSVDNTSPGQKLIRIDFIPSSLSPVPVTLLGGSWEVKRGSLVQDTTRQEFTLNQIPARALLGRHPLKISKGVKLKVSMIAQAAIYTTEQGQTLTMEEYMSEHLGAFRVMLPVQVTRRIGLGLINKQGTGLELLIDTHQGDKAEMLRSGEDMEESSSELQLPSKIIPGDQIHELTLEVSQGRVRVLMADQLITDELAGFPLAFEGFPSISCQNMRCSILSIEVSQP